MNQEFEQMFHWLDMAQTLTIDYAPRMIGALVVYLVGKWIVNRVVAVFHLVMDKRRIDPALKTFFTSFLKIGLTILLLLAIIGLVGIPIAGFAAIIAGLAFGVGSALNGSLGNVAGGIVILINRPFSIGDLIEAQGKFGIVTEIGLIDTTLLTSQNMTVHLPNGALSTGVINNYTDQKNLRIDLKVPVAEGTDIDAARRIAVEVMSTHPDVLKDPAPAVKVTQITDNGCVLVLWPRIAIKQYSYENPRQMEADYYSVYFGVQELVKTAFTKAGIVGPNAVSDVHLVQ
ncbi:MAG: mechanosensitive ion channel [Nevskiaceae bacterium]|nr:MAG: mechanosensitive ion channel [Nevskiaceae bacterium]TBR71983.1 MAG: mechanosensitive ion channel [Nevskiaceae bacterium]